jgi:hypothetical protein
MQLILAFLEAFPPQPRSSVKIDAEARNCGPGRSAPTSAAVCSRSAPIYSKSGKHQRPCLETRRNCFERSLKRLSSPSTSNVVAPISPCVGVAALSAKSISICRPAARRQYAPTRTRSRWYVVSQTINPTRSLRAFSIAKSAEPPMVIVSPPMSSAVCAAAGIFPISNDHRPRQRASW